MVEETRKILEQVICTKTPMHRVSIGLTEAEAAAVYAGNEHYQVKNAHQTLGLRLFSSSYSFMAQEEDTLLVCDAGGGTTVRKICEKTDLNVSINSQNRMSMY